MRENTEKEDKTEVLQKNTDRKSPFMEPGKSRII